MDLLELGCTIRKRGLYEALPEKGVPAPSVEVVFVVFGCGKRKISVRQDAEAYLEILLLSLFSN